MNYLLKNNNRDKGLSKPSIIIFFILAIALLFYIFAPRFASESVFSIARPIWSVERYFSERFANLSSWLMSKEQLVRENTKLQTEAEGAQAALQTLDTYRKENESLKIILGRTPAEKRILAAIIVKPNRSSYDTLILDAGRLEGVEAGDKVISGDFFIGTIGEVLAHQSKANLISSHGEAFPVLIGDKNIQAEAIGRGGGNFLVKLPKDLLVSKGDLIRLPGLSPKFFGVVSSVEQTITSSSQFILFSLPLNVNELQWVEIIK